MFWVFNLLFERVGQYSLDKKIKVKCRRYLNKNIVSYHDTKVAYCTFLTSLENVEILMVPIKDILTQVMQNVAFSGEVVRPKDAAKTLNEEKTFLLAN